MTDLAAQTALSTSGATRVVDRLERDAPRRWRPPLTLRPAARRWPGRLARRWPALARRWPGG